MLKNIWTYARSAIEEFCRRVTVCRRFVRSYAKDNKPRFSASLDGGIGLYYWDETDNLGDYLSYVVCDHLVRNRIPSDAHGSGVLYAIGSIIGFIRQDATVWGSGILSPDWAYRLYAKFSNLDIRAVRGPNTAKVLRAVGKQVPDVYGDPAILMPLVYQPQSPEISQDVSFIPHFSDKTVVPQGVTRIEIQTHDYKAVIDQIVSSRRVISSSLHGIILAETYGVPAVLLLHDYQNVFKYEDWYLSTGRRCVFARTFDEAMRMQPLPLPELNTLQKGLLDAFPTDMWKA